MSKELPACSANPKKYTTLQLTHLLANPQVREFVEGTGLENIGKRLVNSREGKIEFEKPNMTLEALVDYGNLLVEEQENVRRVQLADSYMSGAELAGSSGSSMPEAVKSGLLA